MLVSSSGEWVGGISGGCLEGDALKRSQKAIFSNQVSRVVYDTMDDDENEIGVGLGCNGRIEVLFSPIDPSDPHNPIAQLKTISKSKYPSLLLKVVDANTASPHLGYSQLVNSNSTDLNFCNIDAQELNTAIYAVKNQKRPALFTFQNGKETLKVLIEFIKPETRLFIVGDNYDVAALVGIAHELGWECHIVGRKKKISKTIFNIAKSIWEYEEFDPTALDEFSAIILMSHDYQKDKMILPQVIDKNLPYIGMLGPKKRMLKMQKDLGRKDLDKLMHFHSPVGLDIGAESPEEIALAIAAEIVSVFRDRDGQKLRFRKGVIHDRG